MIQDGIDLEPNTPYYVVVGNTLQSRGSLDEGDELQIFRIN